MKIVVADDDLELLGLIGFALRQAGYLVLEAGDGDEALRLYQHEQPDLVILDVNMPRANGFEVCKAIRAQGMTPVMMLTVRGSEEDQVQGLDLGADDYLTKPFSPRMLCARVRALLRRVDIDRPAPLSGGPLTLDTERQTVQIEAAPPIRLTNLEFRLLQYLLSNLDRTITSERLTVHVWGYAGVGDRQLLKQLVHRLRQKIELTPTQPQYVITVPGIGYMLQSRPAGQ